MMKLFLSVVVILMSIPSYAQSAGTPQNIVFSEKELDAAFTLIRPELNKLDLTGRSGTLEPAPALKFMGIDTLSFDMNLTFIADIFDLQFNHVRNKPFKVQFQDEGLVLIIPIEDQQRAIDSSMASISFKGVTLIGALGFKQKSNGEQILVLKSVNVMGDLAGTGVLRGKFIMKKVRELLMGVLEKQLNKLLAKENVQELVKKGLLGWSQFYTGEDFHSLVPGSLKVNASGIQFQAQY